MTEKEWLDCQEPVPILVFLRGDTPCTEPDTRSVISDLGIPRGPGQRISLRKLLLFTAACCRPLWNIALGGAVQSTLGAYQRYAYGLGRRDQFEQTISAATALSFTCWTDDPLGAAHVAHDAACWLAWDTARESIAVTCADATEEDRWLWGFSGPPDPVYWASLDKVRSEQAELLREIVGNPFRPVETDLGSLASHSETVSQLARVIHEERCYENMPYLADALEDAGCTEPAILDHCRGPNRHVRGCWVTDLLLGKT
jgi:hypothetical protein